MKPDNTKINCENRRAIDRYFRSKRFNNKKTKKKKQQYCRYLLEYSESIGKSIKKLPIKEVLRQTA